MLRRGTLEEARTDATGQASLRVWVRPPLGVAALPRRSRYSTSAISCPRLAPYAQSFVMLPREPTVVRDASVGGTVSGKHGLALILPSNALGMPGGSSVDISLTPIDTSGSGITAAPSTTFLVQPWDYNNETILSYGMAELVVRRSGTATVADLVQPAILDIPLYARQHPDGRAVTVGERLAVATLDRSSLRHFNSEWHPLDHSGQGEVIVAAGSPTGLALRTMLWPNDGGLWPLPLSGHFSAIALPGSRSIEVNVVPPAGETLPAQSLFRVWGNVTSRGAPQAAFDYGDALSVRSRYQRPSTEVVSAARCGIRGAGRSRRRKHNIFRHHIHTRNDSGDEQRSTRSDASGEAASIHHVPKRSRFIQDWRVRGGQG